MLRNSDHAEEWQRFGGRSGRYEIEEQRKVNRNPRESDEKRGISLKSFIQTHWQKLTSHETDKVKTKKISVRRTIPIINPTIIDFGKSSIITGWFNLGGGTFSFTYLL